MFVKRNVFKKKITAFVILPRSFTPLLKRVKNTWTVPDPTCTQTYVNFVVYLCTGDKGQRPKSLRFEWNCKHFPRYQNEFP